MDHDLKSRVELALSCFDLPSADLLSKSDPMVVVSLKEAKGWREIGRTEGVSNNNSPVFLKRIQMDYFFEEAQDLRFDVYDLDAKETDPLSSHDYLGYFETSLGSLASSRGQCVQERLKKKDGTPAAKGDIRVAMEELAANAEIANISMCANNLCKMDLFGKSDPYCEIYRVRSASDKVLVHKTEVVKVNLNPVWNPFSLRLKKLCGDDRKSPIEIKLYDWDGDNTKPDYMGEIKTSVEEILELLKSGGKASFPVTKEKDRGAKKPKQRGTLTFNRFEITRQFTFLDYLKGGMQVSLIVCVDFTGSNGDPRDPSSLHYRNPSGEFNQYENVISTVGSIVAPYDSDQKFPVWGFGGAINKQTSHCFPMGPYGGQECVGVQGIMQAYAAAFTYVTLSGPTYFKEIFAAAGNVASEGCSSSHQNYYIVLVLTDGVINDLQPTIDTIVANSDKPLSFIIVGIGHADFAAMDHLDGDVQPLRSSDGKISKRDIVQFVPFSKFAKMGVTALARELLAEVPDQVTGYMRSHNFSPMPPRQFVPVPHPLGEVHATS